MSACTYKVNMYITYTYLPPHMNEQTRFLQNLHPVCGGPTSFSALRAQSKNTWHGSDGI